MAFRLFPRNEVFFDLFDESAERIVEVAKAFQSLLKDPPRFRENARAVKEIEHQADKVTHLIGEIASASSEQAQGIAQVNTAVNEMDRVVQQNAATAEESASASEEMNAQAEQMKSTVNEMVIFVEGGSGSADHAAAGSPRKRRPAARHQVPGDVFTAAAPESFDAF